MKTTDYDNVYTILFNCTGQNLYFNRISQQVNATLVVT